MNAEKIVKLGVVRAAGFTGSLKSSTIVEQGSDRMFFRLSEKQRTAVLMISPSGDPDFKRWIEVGSYLHKRGLGSPEILEVDEDAHAVVMEDLGDTTLYAYCRKSPSPAQLASVYSEVVDALVRLQNETLDSLSTCGPVYRRTFDLKPLLWETRYFTEKFLQADMGVPKQETEDLQDEFERLAKAVSDQPRTFMHRDFQSQNILLKEGRVRFVDFQGARKGSFVYDLASLLKDSYIDLPGALSRDLLKRYARESAVGTSSRSSSVEHDFLLAGLQRNMQALGAFAFLSRVKKKTQFRKYIPQGLTHLRSGLKELADSARPPGALKKLSRLLDKLKTP